jgi:hypothetical protein
MADETTTDTGLDSREALRSVLGDMSGLKMPKLRSSEDIMKSYEDRAKDSETYLKKKGELEIAKARGESESARELSAKFEPQFQKAGDFQPSEENKAALIGLFGLIGAIGAFGGGKSYGSALGAMNAMGGMLKGYQQGRKDLFEREKAEFDKHIIAVKQHNDEVTKAFARAKEAAKSNLGAAQAKLVSELTALGATIQAKEVREKGLVAGEEASLKSYNAASKAYRDRAAVISQMQKTFEDKDKGRAVYASIDGVKGYYSEGQLRQATADGRAVEPVAKPTDKARTTASDEEIEQTAQGIANYAVKAPGLNNRNRDKIMAKVRQINPSYNEGDFANRQVAERNWTNPNGAGAKQIQAFNTVYQHLETIEKLGDALDNNDIQAKNKIINYFRTQLGHPEVTNFDAAKQAVASEIVKAITGTAGALADRQEAERILADYSSPKQTKGVVSTLRELIGGRYVAAARQYAAGTGKTEQDFKRFLPEDVNRYFGGAQSRSSSRNANLKKATDEVLASAKKKINEGADRAAVVKRLEELGYSDEGL